MSDLDYTHVKAVFDALMAEHAHPNGQHPDGEWEPPTPVVDWVQAYGLGDDPARWLYEPLLPDQGAVAIFAKGGTGKSLLALWLAAELATRPEPVDVLYLDYEMTIQTVVDRLMDMGHDDPLTMEHLTYCSLPTLPALDTVEGGRAVVDMAKHYGVALVVIDTFGRAVNGEEDSADTVRAWYRWTGQLLKAAGIAFLRIDHAGKDIKRGQRGTSAKNDDVDLVWEMSARDHGEFLLRATKRRVNWIAERVVLRQTDDNGILAYHWDDGGVSYLHGTRACAKLLDELGAPVDISRSKALVLLRQAGQGKANNVVADALRYRREAEYRGPVQASPGASEEPSTGVTEIVTPQQVHPEYRPVPGGDPYPLVGGDYVVVPPVEGGFPGLFDELPEENTP